jgi:hypothetical protein
MPVGHIEKILVNHIEKIFVNEMPLPDGQK